MASREFPEWTPLLAELESRRTAALAGGGEARIAREHRLGRRTARERIADIVDEGSFLEFGTLVTTPSERGSLPSTFICGLAQIDSRPVAIGAEDFTVEGGGVGVHLSRIKGSWGGFIEEFALGYRIPLIILIQGVGGSVHLQEMKGYPELVSAMPSYPMFDLLKTVPVITAVLGPTAGSSAARAAISHFSVMTENNGCLFAGGPPLVKQALGVDIDKFQLGGADVQVRAAGLIDNVADSDADALVQIRKILSYLPDNAAERANVVSPDGWVAPDQSELLSIVSPNGRRAYDAHALIRCLCDVDSFFEIGGEYGQSLRTGLARIEGHVVGILATDNRHLAGALDALSSQKQSRFIDLCNTFHIPLVYLVDIPGFMIGPDSERSGTMKFATQALRAIQQVSVPVYTIQVRRSFGLGGQATGNTSGVSIRLAWPSGSWGDMPLEGGIESAFRAQLEAAPPSERAKLRQVFTERFAAQTSIWRTVERFGVEEMIDPRQTRTYLARLLPLARRIPLAAG